MTANSPLGPQFNFGWNNKKGKKFKTKTDVTRDKVSYYLYNTWKYNVHVCSTLAYVQVHVGREERQATCMNMQVPVHTLENTRIPSLKNWDGGLESLAANQLSPHI